MDPEPPNLSRGTGLWLQWADTERVRSDAEGKAFDEIVPDYRVSSDAWRELLTDPTGTTSATHEAVANSRLARALPIKDAVEHGGTGKLNCHVDPDQVIDPEQRIVPRRPMQEAGDGWESIAPDAATPRKGRSSSCPDCEGSAMSESELPLTDVPLIVEDLLLQAKRVADAGASTEAIEKILEHVAALREGRS